MLVALWSCTSPVFFTAVATAEPTVPTPIIATFISLLLLGNYNIFWWLYGDAKVSRSKSRTIIIALDIDNNSEKNAIFLLLWQICLFLRYFEYVIIPKIMLNNDGTVPKKTSITEYIE